MKKIMTVIMTAAVLSTSGCTAAAVGYAAYKMAESRQESTKTLARSLDGQAYANYCAQMARVNLERERAGLKPAALMTEADWLAARER